MCLGWWCYGLGFQMASLFHDENFAFFYHGLGALLKFQNCVSCSSEIFVKIGVFSSPPSSGPGCGGGADTAGGGKSLQQQDPLQRGRSRCLAESKNSPVFPQFLRNPYQNIQNLVGTPNPKVITMRIYRQNSGSEANGYHRFIVICMAQWQMSQTQVFFLLRWPIFTRLRKTE